MGDVFTMSADTVLDERMMDIILSQGYSRIPIYAPDNNRNFIGMLLVKILITYDPEDAKRVRDFSLATLPETAPYTVSNLYTSKHRASIPRIYCFLRSRCSVGTQANFPSPVLPGHHKFLSRG